MTCPYQYFTIVFALVFLTVVVLINNLSVICLHSVVLRCCFKSMFLVMVTLIWPHSHGQKKGDCFWTPGTLPSLCPSCLVCLKLSCNISSLRRSVSSPDETPRRELKIWSTMEYFWWTLRCFICWRNTVSNAWYYFSNKIILEGETKDAKMSSFSCDFKTLININFLCIFFMNY